MPETSNDSLSEIKLAVINLTKNVEGAMLRAQDGRDRNLQDLLAGNGGWDIVEVLKTAATCAFTKQMPPDHPDVILVRDQLRTYGF